MMATVIRNGFLWKCHKAGLNGTNGTYTGHGTNVDRSGIHWFKLQTGSEVAPLTLAERGRVVDGAQPNNAWWYHYSSLAVNCPGDMVAGFSGSSATNYISAFYTSRLANGSTLQRPRLIRAGTVAYDPTGFGDYSATVVDPTDDWTFWTVQEHATPTGFLLPPWATVISTVKPIP